jgi:hypothetical protein
MDWQLLAVIAALVLALAYVARSTWRTWSGTGKACASACGGCVKPAPMAAEAGRRITLPQV